MFFISNAMKFIHGGYVAVLMAAAILSIMYIWHKSHLITMKLREIVRLDSYKEQLDHLRQDSDLPKYTNNLVCLTSCIKSNEIDRKIMYFILDKRPKKADIYWFVNVTVTDDPYQAEYLVETFGTSYIVKIQLRLGFRVDQKLNVFLRQITTDLLRNKVIEPQESTYSMIPGRNIGDFRFVIIQEVLSHNSNLPAWQSFLLKSKLVIQRFTVSPSKWFGLDTSDVYVEKVPLFIGHPNQVVLKRVEK